MIGGVRVKLQVAHVKLCYSRAFIIRAYLLQTHEMLFDAHNHAFRVLGGVPRRGIYDNMRTAVDRVGRGKERSVNVRFAAMASHYLFEAEFCNPASGWEKGQVEKNVQDARHRLWQAMPPFERPQRPERLAGAALSGALGETPAWQRARNDRRCMGPRSESLMPVGRPFDGFVEHTKRVSPTCLCIWSATATACRPLSPTGRSACASIPTGSSSRQKDMSSASIPGSSSGPTPARADDL